MDRSALEQAVYRDFGYADSPVAAVSNRVRGYLNDRHRRLCARPGLEKYRFQTETFSTAASTAVYVMTADIEKLLKLSDTTNSVPLYQRSLDWWRQIEPNTTNTSGISQYWVDLGLTPALRDISTGSGTGLWVVSTVAGDNTQSVHVETIDAVGSMTDTTASLNGTTRVQVGTATNHMRLIRFAVSASHTGVIELYDAAAAGNKVSSIWLHRANAQFVKIGLWPAASAINTIQVDFIHHIRDFSQNYDEPQLPLDFHYLVALGAKIDEARKKGPRGDERVTEWVKEWEQGIRELTFHTVGMDTIFVPGTLGHIPGSNLGPWFPRGRW